MQKGLEVKPVAISKGDKFSISSNRPRGTTGPYLSCWIFLSSHIYSPGALERLSWLAKGEHVPCLVCRLESTSAGLLGRMWRVLRFLLLELGVFFHSSSDRLVAASLRKLQFIFDCSGRAFENTDVQQTNSLSLHGAGRPHLTQGPGNALLWTFAAVCFHRLSSLPDLQTDTESILSDLGGVSSITTSPHLHKNPHRSQTLLQILKLSDTHFSCSFLFSLFSEAPLHLFAVCHVYAFRAMDQTRD